MAKYKVTIYKPEDEDEDATWDAQDWCYMVHHSDDVDDIVCICATDGEAKHIMKLLEAQPYDATAPTD